VLLNIIRGAGVDGLRGIPYRRGRIVRPLLDIGRDRIEAYCVDRGITPCRDKSNETVKYSRNRVRNELIPYLEEHFSPNVRDSILRLSLISSEESDYLNSLAAEWLGESDRLDMSAIVGLNPAMQRRVLRLWLGRVSSLTDLEFAHVEFIRSRLGAVFAHTLPNGVPIVSDGRFVERAIPKQSAANGITESVAMSVPGEATFGTWVVTAIGELPAGAQAVVRTLIAGDRMRFSFGRKKLSDIFGEAKFPEPERWSVPLLVDSTSGEVLAIANFRVTDAAPGLGFTARRCEL
jgi:tRNA(Ile)-lysidine synthetase-like protein